MKEWSTLKKLIWLRKINGGGGSGDPLNTFTGAIVRFLAKKAKPIVKLEANFTPIQDLNGYDAPWPPGGGKNLCPVAEDSRNPSTFWGAGQSDLKAAINGLSAGTYTITIKYKILQLPVSGSVSYGVYATKSGGTLIGYSITTDNSPTVGKVYTVSKKFTLAEADVGTVTNFYLYCDDSSTHSGTSEVRGLYSAYDIQIESGETATDFAPYSNICPISGHTGCDIFDKAEYDAAATPTVSISFGQTVYSGTLDVVSGELTLTHGIITANGTESWTKPDNCFKTESLHADSDYPQGISNTYTVATSYSGVNGNNNRIAAHSTWFRIHDERFSTTDAFKTYLSENNVQFVYELATPITIPLTAQQIQTLVGNNVVWVTDATGDITVQAYGTEIV